jgi:hypothetical protein
MYSYAAQLKKEKIVEHSFNLWVLLSYCTKCTYRTFTWFQSITLHIELLHVYKCVCACRRNERQFSVWHQPCCWTCRPEVVLVVRADCERLNLPKSGIWKQKEPFFFESWVPSRRISVLPCGPSGTVHKKLYYLGCFGYLWCLARMYPKKSNL